MSYVYYKTIFSRNLAYQMNKAGLTSVDIARKLSVSKATVFDWVHGNKLPRAEKVEALCRLFKIDQKQLLLEERNTDFDISVSIDRKYDDEDQDVDVLPWGLPADADREDPIGARRAELGRSLRERRKESGMTLDEVAELVGVNKSTIQRYETGMIDHPKAPVVRSIYDALGCSGEEIFGDERTTRKAVAAADSAPERTAAIPERTAAALERIAIALERIADGICGKEV